MQVIISGHHVEITEALREHVNKRVDKLQRHFDNITNVEVILTVENNVQKAEATAHLAGADLHANCASEDMYSAIDSMVNKLDRQVLRHKEKVKAH